MAIWSRIRKYDKDVRTDKEYAKEVEEKMKETEKGDFLSMCLSALLVLWVPCALVLAGLGVIAYFVLGS